MAEPTGASLPLECKGVSVEIDGHRLLDDVSLRLDAGPRSVVLGPNGAGKTLLLRLLHGMAEATSGEVWAGGRPLDRRGRTGQAMVFQRPVLLRRSAAANLRYALRSRGVRGEALRERSQRWLERAGLAAYAERSARVLSGGEQQRLALARALCLEPEVLLLDEPTASLDPASIIAIEAMINAAHAAGTKVVLVTHELDQAKRMADEVVFLYAGRIEARAPAAAFFRDPGSDKARAYLEGKVVV